MHNLDVDGLEGIEEADWGAEHADGDYPDGEYIDGECADGEYPDYEQDELDLYDEEDGPTYPPGRTWLLVAAAAALVLAGMLVVAGRDRFLTSASEKLDEEPTSSTVPVADAEPLVVQGEAATAALNVELGGATAATGAASTAAETTATDGSSSTAAETPAGAAEGDGPTRSSGATGTDTTGTAETTGGTGTADTAAATTAAPTTASTEQTPATASADQASRTPIAVVGMTSLGNVAVRNNRAGYSFTADRSGEIESLRLYYIVNTHRPGYAKGTGGTMDVRIAPDDGSGLPDDSRTFAGSFQSTFGLSNGAPSGDKSSFIKNTLLGNWTFDQAIPVQQGERYHIIFDNIDGNPTANYVSLDMAIDLVPDGQSSPVPSPARRTDFGFVEDHGSGWYKADAHRSGHWRTPIFEVTYADGGSQGQGFMQWRRQETFTLSGSAAIRTTIELDHTRTISELSARVAQSSGSIVLELTTIDGSVLRSATVSASGAGNYRNAVWVTGTVEPLTLEAGTGYALVVRAGPGYSGTVIPLLAGGQYGFSNASVFPYGRAQISSDGRSWSDWGGGKLYQSIAVN